LILFNEEPPLTLEVLLRRESPIILISFHDDSFYFLETGQRRTTGEGLELLLSKLLQSVLLLSSL